MYYAILAKTVNIAVTCDSNMERLKPRCLVETLASSSPATSTRVPDSNPQQVSQPTPWEWHSKSVPWPNPHTQRQHTLAGPVLFELASWPPPAVPPRFASVGLHFQLSAHRSVLFVHDVHDQRSKESNSQKGPRTWFIEYSPSLQEFLWRIV